MDYRDLNNLFEATIGQVKVGDVDYYEEVKEMLEGKVTTSSYKDISGIIKKCPEELEALNYAYKNFLFSLKVKNKKMKSADTPTEAYTKVIRAARKLVNSGIKYLKDNSYLRQDIDTFRVFMQKEVSVGRWNSKDLDYVLPAKKPLVEGAFKNDVTDNPEFPEFDEDSGQPCEVCGGEGCNECEPHNANDPTMIQCPNCLGEGWTEEGECENCNGYGSVSNPDYVKPSFENEEIRNYANEDFELCPECDGRGAVECDTCGGSGWDEEYEAEYDEAQRCEDCGGEGEIECDLCSGTGEGEQINSQFMESITPHRWSVDERKAKKKSLKKAHKGTNFKLLRPKEHFKRIKIGNQYVIMPMSSTERNTRKKVGRAVGKKHIT